MHLEALGREDSSVISVAYFALGETYIEEGKIDEALDMFQRSADIRYGGKDPRTSGTANLIGRLLSFQGKPAEAEVLHRKALDAHLREFSERHRNTAQYYNSVGLCYLFQKRCPEAQTMFTKALESCNLNGESAAECYRYLAESHILQEQFEEVETFLELALDIMTSLPRDLDQKTTDLYFTWVKLYKSEAKWQAAEELCSQSLAVHVEKLGEDCDEALIFMQLLSQIYKLQGRFTDFEDVLRELVGKYKHRFGEDEILATLYTSLSGACLLTGKLQEGIALSEACYELLRKLLGPDHIDALQTQTQLKDLQELIKQMQDCFPTGVAR